MAYIEMKHSFKRYQMGDTEIVANHDISFEIEKGELVIILGASGAGKSTVLNILGGMDTNDEGDILIDGQNITDYNSHQLTDYRRNDVGFVFQFYNLVPNLTAKENVELASEIVKDAQDPVAVLNAVGMENKDDESAGSGSCYTKNGDLTDHKEAELTPLPRYRQPAHVVRSRYGIVGLAVGNGGFYVKTDQPTTNDRPLPKTIP